MSSVREDVLTRTLNASGLLGQGASAGMASGASATLAAAPSPSPVEEGGDLSRV